ncbi:DNA cytosine methyltransferase [Altericista sp. CCNU0014]|uniref:DNA cytosine methyltransferase n=1 Tax=Altericista sp. CCNU0014 TaxID=3082949 RepID=UPI00384E5E03
MSQRPIGIDLFAGAGGLSLGFEQAGFDVVAAVEVDPVHAAVHAFNFPNCAVLPQSVAKLSGDSIRQAAGIGDRPVDVVFGGAPCQGFSLIGQRALEDPRNALVREFVRIVSELDASYFAFENVKGLTVGKHRLFLEELIAAFDARGYRVLLPWKVLNASFFGVPQNRERLILMGARQGLPLPEYPDPITRPAGVAKFSALELPEGPSCYDALSDLPDPEGLDELLKRDRALLRKWRQPDTAYAREMRCLEESAWHFGYLRQWDSKLLTSSLRTNHSEISRRRFAQTLPGQTEPISRFFKLSAGGVANTLRAGTDSARGAFTSPRPIHYEKPRCITVREMARLHGFPDWFRLQHTKWHGARQVGNSVPPPLVRHVAAKLLEAMGVEPMQPQNLLKLGDPALLEMDMSQAARYWDIEVPIGRRERLSSR